MNRFMDSNDVRASVRRSFGLVGLLLAIGQGMCTVAAAQAVEDHSLPGSVIKTYHVKCSAGRLAMIRYDTRQDPTRVCVSVQDGSKRQRCEVLPKAQVPGKLGVLAQEACQ